MMARFACSFSKNTLFLFSTIDDHASNIEMAIANALIKKGIAPPRPKIKDSSRNNDDDTHG